MGKDKLRKQWVTQRKTKMAYTEWDLEFDRFQKKDLREEIRQQRDRMVEVLANLELKQKTGEETAVDKIKENREELEKKKEAQSELERQIKLLDDEISGETVITPEGMMQPSVESRLDGLRDVKEKFNRYLNVK